MLWFKHLTTSFSDPDFLGAEIEFGASGPHVFWRSLEILAKENAIEKPLKMSEKVFRSYFPGVKPNKIWSVLGYFLVKKRIEFERNSDGTITIFCPKLSLLSDTYTQKVRTKVKQASNKGYSRREKIELELELEDKKREEGPIPSFSFFLNLFKKFYFDNFNKDYIINEKDTSTLKAFPWNGITEKRFVHTMENCMLEEFHKNHFTPAYVCNNFSKLENYVNEEAEAEKRTKERTKIVEKMRADRLKAQKT